MLVHQKAIKPSRKESAFDNYWALKA